MNEEIKAKADELIQKYFAKQVTVMGCTNLNGSNPCVITNNISVYDAKELAILTCQSIIDEQEFMKSECARIGRSSSLIIPRITFYKGVITAIEQQ